MDVSEVFSGLNNTEIGKRDKLTAVKAALVKYFHDCPYYFDVDLYLTDIFDEFSFNKIISLWAGREIEILKEDKNCLSQEERGILFNIIFDSELSLKGFNPDILGEIYLSSLSGNEKKASGSTYTPAIISEYMTDLVRRNIRPNDKMLDPACGCGVFLSLFYDALMQKLATNKNEATIEETHTRIIETLIYGIDISPVSCAIAKTVLALKYKKCVICPNIYCCDALTDTPIEITEAGFNWIMMNPPYVGHKRIASDYMKKLKGIYSEVYYNKGDLSYCFFMLCEKLLCRGGSVVAVTGRYFAQGLYAAGLREFLLKNYIFEHIVDFYGQRPFKNAGVDPMIILLKKGSKKNNVFPVIKLTGEMAFSAARYYDYRDMLIYVNQASLNSAGFNFLKEDELKIVNLIEAKAPNRLGSVMKIFQGVISGCDAAFTVPGGSLIYESCVMECGVKWIKSKDIANDGINFTGEYLLYTNGKTEAEIPYTLEKLRFYRNTLAKRRECITRTRKWYELQWGRKRESFEKPKIVFPYKSADNRFCADSEGFFFSADVYGMYPNKKYRELDLNKLAMLLNTELYEQYYHTFSKKLGGELYEYYPNTVERIMIPDTKVINSFENEDDIYRYFEGEAAR